MMVKPSYDTILSFSSANNIEKKNAAEHNLPLFHPLNIRFILFWFTYSIDNLRSAYHGGKNNCFLNLENPHLSLMDLLIDTT